MKKIPTKSFKVVSVASNQNSFGLTGMILLAADGEAFEVAANSISLKPQKPSSKFPFWEQM